MGFPQEIEFYNNFGDIKVRSYLGKKYEKTEIEELDDFFQNCFAGNLKKFHGEMIIFSFEDSAFPLFGFFLINGLGTPACCSSTINDVDKVNLVKKMMAACVYAVENIIPSEEEIPEFMARILQQLAGSQTEIMGETPPASTPIHTLSSDEIDDLLEKSRHWKPNERPEED